MGKPQSPDHPNPYLALGNREPKAGELFDIVRVLDKKRTPDIKSHISLANACIEIATTPRYQGSASSMLQLAAGALESAAVTEPRPEEPRDRQLQLRADMYRAFLPLYTRELCDRQPIELSHEQALLTSLHGLITVQRIAQNSRATHKNWYEWGEIMVHMLNARSNVRQGQITQHTSPSFLRYQPQPGIPRHNIRTDWDLSVSRNGLFAACQRVKLLNTTNPERLGYAPAQFAPDIHRLSLIDDLKTANPHNTFATLRQEKVLIEIGQIDDRGVPPTHRFAAQAHVLDTLTENLLAHIWPSENIEQRAAYNMSTV